MRLIDADDRKLRTELMYYTCDTGIDEAPYLFAVDMLDKAPSVDAIPIAWIDEWVEKNCFIIPDAIKDLICDFKDIGNH